MGQWPSAIGLLLLCAAGCNEEGSGSDAGGGGAGASGICREDRWCWENPAPQGNDLVAVGGTSSDDVWALDGRRAAIHWDGRNWSSAALPSDGLRALWAAGPSDVWAVGAAGAIAHFDGKSWSSLPSPTQAALASVHGIAANDVWAVGSDVVHWDGSRWSIVAAPGGPFSGVWGAASDDVWVVGPNAIAHWDGTAWSIGVAPPVADLAGRWCDGGGEGGDPCPAPTVGVTAVWGAAADDVWAVGARILRWDGRSWSEVVAPPGLPRTRVWGTATDDVWAASLGEVLHWDGAAWSSVDSPPREGPPSFFRGVWAAGESDAWVVGDYGLVRRWDGTAWRSVDSRLPLDLRSAWFAGPDLGWAVSKGAWRWDGKRWSLFDPGVEAGGAVFGTGMNDVWAVGTGVAHYDGASWSRVAFPFDAGLAGVWASGPNDVWVVGSEWPGGLNWSRSLIAHFDGAAWKVAQRGTSTTGSGSGWMGIWGSSASDVWVAGDREAAQMAPQGIVAHFDGKTWSEVAIDGAGSLSGISGSAPTDVWAVGVFGHSAFHFDGISWRTYDPSGAPALFGVWAVGPKEAWAVGDKGTIVRWDGATWSVVPSLTDEQLFGVAGPRSGEVWVGGALGTVLRRSP